MCIIIILHSSGIYSFVRNTIIVSRVWIIDQWHEASLQPHWWSAGFGRILIWPQVPPHSVVLHNPAIQQCGVLHCVCVYSPMAPNVPSLACVDILCYGKLVYYIWCCLCCLNTVFVKIFVPIKRNWTSHPGKLSTWLIYMWCKINFNTVLILYKHPLYLLSNYSKNTNYCILYCCV